MHKNGKIRTTKISDCKIAVKSQPTKQTSSTLDYWAIFKDTHYLLYERCLDYIAFNAYMPKLMSLLKGNF